MNEFRDDPTSKLSRVVHIIIILFIYLSIFIYLFIHFNYLFVSSHADKYISYFTSLSKFKHTFRFQFASRDLDLDSERSIFFVKMHDCS